MRFVSIRAEGGLLPSELFQRLVERDPDLDGLTEASYHLVDGARLHEAITESWTRLGRVWAAFQEVIGRVDDADPATGLTRDRWLLPLFQELGYGRLVGARPLEVDGKSYSVSHAWQNLPIHLVGWNVDLDRRTAGVAGAAKVSPHGLMQELVNRSKTSTWGVVSNGRRLRLLRDNVSLTRQAYVEFDLEAMFRGEVYSDFVVLWLLLHQSRVEGERSSDWWIEHWTQEAHRQGARLLDRLRDGVQRAIETLGQGFLAHPRNEALRFALQSGELDRMAYYRQLLRLVYRLLFLFVAEDRGVLHDPAADKAAVERYTLYYSTARLRDLAGRLRGTAHGDLWQALSLVMEKLGDDRGCPELGLPALNGGLWNPEATKDLNSLELPNQSLLSGVRALAWTETDRLRRPVDYRNLGPEELGSVYESLLELHPEMNVAAGSFTLTTAHGHERKTTGSYYTPPSLVQALLDSALDPVLDEAARSRDPGAAILALKVCDPACGSGHFLIAAAHRIARRLAAVRTGDDEPSPGELRHALRDVIGRCVYGVDVNEMAVELCKVALWMEALEPGKPLSFLDHRIVCGNSLLGTTPALLAQGIPDEAFQPIEGDDKAVAIALRRRNRKEREGQMQLPMVAEPGTTYGELDAGFRKLAAAGDESIADLHEKEEWYRNLLTSTDYRKARLVADAWCAAFVWRKVKEAPEPITEDVFRRLESNPLRVPAETVHEVERLAAQYGFLHWHLVFPDVFRLPRKGEKPENGQAGWSGGFDVVLGNPPWERVKLQEKEWFASRQPEIAEASNAAARRKMITTLKLEDPALFADWTDALRSADGESHLVRDSGRYPLCGRGDINTYSIFAETNRLIMGATGRVGCIVPTGIATDDTTKLFFRDLTETRTLASLYSFFEIRRVFLDTDSRGPFCLLTLTGWARPAAKGAEFMFFIDKVDDLRDAWRRFTLSAEDIALLNPNTRTCPVFRSKRDAELTKAMYRRVPVLLAEGPPEVNPWGVAFLRMFDMANDSGLFRTREQLVGDGWELSGNIFRRGEDAYLPLYEAKMGHHFNHRFGDYADYPEGTETTSLPDVPVSRLEDPEYVVQPRYWVPQHEVLLRSADIPEGLAQAYRARTREVLLKFFLYWCAGHHLNRGNPKPAEIAFVRLFGQPWKSMIGAIGDFLLASKGAPELEQRYPLMTEETAEISRAYDDPLATARRLIERRCRGWLLGWRDISRATDERTVIASVIPSVGVGHTTPLIFLPKSTIELAGCLVANLSAFILDYCARQKVGGTHLTYGYMNQLPVLNPAAFADPTPWGVSGENEPICHWLLPRVIELAYTAWDLESFARDSGYDGPPFRWNDERRFVLRCELDAAFFHLYGVGRDDADYILETFPIVRRDDMKRWGEYRTKRTVLDIYDAMTTAIQGGKPYVSTIDPPPADPRVAHPPQSAHS